MKRVAAAAYGLDPPLQDVADGRLSCLDLEIAGQNRSVYDAADAGNVGQRAARGRNRAIAGRGPDDLHEGAGLDARSDGAVVRVEAAHRDGDAGAECERSGPVGAQMTGW